MNSGKEKERVDPDSGDSTNIYVYSLQHDSGYSLLYVNKSKNLTLDEDIMFTM